MDKFSNELIFYFGVALAATAVILSIIYAVVYFVGRKRLNDKLDVEYGKANKNIK